MELLLQWILRSLIILIVAYLLPGVHIENFLTALALAFILGILNFFIKPLLVLLTLPLTVVTFGLFIFVINALLILFASAIVPGFTVDGFWWAVLFSMLSSLISFIVGQY